MNMDEILEHVEIIEQVCFRLQATGVIRADDLDDLEVATDEIRSILNQYDNS